MDYSRVESLTVLDYGILKPRIAQSFGFGILKRRIAQIFGFGLLKRKLDFQDV